MALGSGYSLRQLRVHRKVQMMCRQPRYLIGKQGWPFCRSCAHWLTCRQSALLPTAATSMRQRMPGMCCSGRVPSLERKEDQHLPVR